MSLIADYGLDVPVRTLLLVALSIKDNNNKTKIDKIHIHKIIRFFEFLCQKTEIDFSNFKKGAVSYELQENIETLEEYGLIDEDPKDNYGLSDIGIEATRELVSNMGSNDFMKLKFAKKQLNDLPFDELLYFMYKIIPETQAQSNEINRLEKKRYPLIKSLYAKGKITSATAAKWLGITEQDFLKLSLKQKLSQTTVTSMIKGYEESTEEDLVISRDFEQVENEVGNECCT